jgi:hypothetical protein
VLCACRTRCGGCVPPVLPVVHRLDNRPHCAVEPRPAASRPINESFVVFSKVAG